MKEQSEASRKRAERRNSPKTIEFKNEINDFLKDKSSIIEYAIKKDLAAMTSMPFYKDRPKRIKIPHNSKELLIEFMKIFMEHKDKEFIVRLLRELNKNQSQTIRKIAPKFGEKSEIWEHVIPAKYIVEELIKMINYNDISELEKLLSVYEKAGQRGITKEQDKLLSEFRSSMPDNWNWRDSNVNPLERHNIIGIKYS